MCRAAPQRSARDPRHRPPKKDIITPAGGVSPPDPRRGEEPAQCAAAAAAAAAGGSRSAARPGADHEDPPTTAPRAPPACLAHTHRLARLLPGAGRSSPYQPHECQLAIPPQRERGSGLIPNCAGHQAVDYRRGAPRRRSLKLPRRPRLPATRRQGARRGAHRRLPHTRPITVDDRQYRHPWPPNAPSQNTHYAHPVIGRPPRHRGMPNLVMTQQLLLGAGKDAECQRRVHPVRAPMLRGRLVFLA